MKAHISVVVLNHNGKHFLQKCLSSIIDQDYPSFEIILVDNASSDGSIEYVKETFPTVTIIHNKVGLGFAGGNMVGAKAATGDLVLLVSNDTWMPKHLISNLANYYKAHSFNVIAPYQGSYDGQPLPDTSSLIDPLGHHIYLKGETHPPFYLTGVCLFCEKDFYLETMGMDADFFLYIEDADWFWRLILFGYTFNYVKGSYIYHSGAGSSGGSDSKKLKEHIFMLRNRNTIYMLLKNYSLLTLCIILPLYACINFIEMIFFLALGKISIVKGYFTSWSYIIQNINTIIQKRSWIQHKRKISDIEVFKRMYKGPAKLMHLLQYYGK